MLDPLKSSPEIDDSNNEAFGPRFYFAYLIDQNRNLFDRDAANVVSDVYMETLVV
jgi:hypothetical protein